MHKSLSVAGLLALCGQAAAQFSGPYAPNKWTFNANGGDGKVDTTGVPDLIVLIGNDNGLPDINTDFTAPVAADGLWSFDWTLIPHDTGTFDVAYYLLNGEKFFLGSFPSNGVVTNVPVSAGDIIGFRVWSSDGLFGALHLKVENFSAPIPAPGVMAAIMIGAGLAARRRRGP